MGERTPKLDLYKPTPGETGWGSLINENFDKIDDITPSKIGAEPAFTKNTAFNKDFGNTAGTVCQGNDPRLGESGNVKPHADTTTKYGGSTDTLYGHAKASSTVPKQAGTANVGAEVNEFARGDHIHQAQTSVSGNAGTATKLKTARNISLTGNIKGTATVFDGTADIAIPVTDVEATKLKTARKIELRGPVTGNADFDGTADIALTTSISSTELPKASKTEYGVVKIGDGIKVDNGVISVIGSSIPIYCNITRIDQGYGEYIKNNAFIGLSPGIIIHNKSETTLDPTEVTFDGKVEGGSWGGVFHGIITVTATNKMNGNVRIDKTMNISGDSSVGGYAPFYINSTAYVGEILSLSYTHISGSSEGEDIHLSSVSGNTCYVNSVTW